MGANADTERQDVHMLRAAYNRLATYFGALVDASHSRAPRIEHEVRGRR